MPELAIEVDEDVFSRLRAFTCSRGLDLGTFVSEQLRAVAEDTVGVIMPASAARPLLFMSRHGGRDQAAAMLATAGWYGFERPMPLHFYASALSFPGLVLDVGANTGFYSLLAACASDQNRVLAFEPDESVLQGLRGNIAANRLEDRITVSDLALSSRTGFATLYVPTQEHGLIETSSSLESAFKGVHSELRQVQVDTLDNTLEKLSVGQQSVSLLKVDVEGHEAAVLEGGARTVARWRPIVFVEVLAGADASTLSRFIAEQGYLDVPLLSGTELVARGTVRFEAHAWNHALVPQERISRFLTLAHSVL